MTEDDPEFLRLLEASGGGLDRAMSAARTNDGPAPKVQIKLDDHLYVIAEEPMLALRPLFVKIGRSFYPKSRIKDLQVGNPRKLVLLYQLKKLGALELMIHNRLAEHRIIGEWFKIGNRELGLFERLRGASQRDAEEIITDSV